MLVLKILGFVLLGLLTVLLIALLIRIDVLASRNEEGELSFFVRVFGIKFGGKKADKEKEKTPEKEKKSKEKKPNKEKEKKSKTPFLLKIMGFYELSSKETLQESIRAIGVSGVAKETLSALRTIFGKLGFIIRHITVRRLHLRCVNGGDDAAAAALDYGKTCAVVYPFIGYLQTVLPHKIRDLDAQVSCDFDRADSLITFDTVVSTRLFFAFWAAVTLVVSNLITAFAKKHRRA